MNTPSLDERGLPIGHPFNPAMEITPRETNKLLDARSSDSGDDIVLIDCRLPPELVVTKIEGAEHIPLQQMQAHADKLMEWRDRKVIVYCRSGGRSLQFANILKQNGFNDVKSMAGGILLWNKDVNPGGPQY